MTGRDRLVVMAITVLVVLGAAWELVVSPERKQVGTLNSQVAAAQAQLTAAEGSAASAREAQAQYAKAYASVVKLGKAVPPSAEVPSLVYELAQASNRKKVEFASITSASADGATPAAGSPLAAAASAGFTQLPFTFVFEGGFFQLEHLFRQLAELTTLEGEHDVQVSGRLLTIQSVKLAPVANNGAGSSSGKLSGSITATAYVLPATQGLTAGASASSPATASTGSSSSSSTTSAAPPAAIVEATP